MKKHLLVIISLIFMVLSFITFNDSVISSDNNNDKSSYLFDRQQSDIESIYNITSSNKTVMPELQNSLPSPSFRLLSSQKKTQQQSINNILLKRFSSEVQPTNNYNTKFSFPLSSKDDLIVIVRHLII
ncbi:MAG: hypothetical protein E7068_06000 [Lentimicrobiaceae bacterium]|nr:hypothetical protein [Lentimicrobiaceae bacterium]